MVIDHIGVVVKSIEKGVALWESAFGYRRMTDAVVNSRQKVRVVFLCKEKSLDVKLVEPTDTSSPVYSFAQKGGGLHHLCFRCESLVPELETLKKLGARVLTKPEPGEAFQGEQIAFVFAGQGLNIELIDTEKRAKLISE